MSLQDIAPNNEKQKIIIDGSISACAPYQSNRTKYTFDMDMYAESIRYSGITKENLVSMIKTNELLEEENKKLRKALLFYTNERNIDFNTRKELRFCNSDDQADVYQTFGTKAKEALNFYK